MKSIFGTSSSRSLQIGSSTPLASSSNPVSSGSNSLTSWAELTEDEAKEQHELKKNLSHAIVGVNVHPSSYVRNEARSGRTGKNNKGKKENARNIVVSKTYNQAASRPIAVKRNRPAQITCNLRIDFAVAFVTSNAAPTFGSSSFNMGQFNGTGQYLGLFDQYRFEELECWFEPQASYLATTNCGILVTAVDVDDATAPTTIESVEDKQNSVSASGICGHYHRFKPHMAVAAYSGAFTSFSNMEADWIDSASNTVQHYGLKWACSATTAAQTYNLTVRARVSFRNPGI
jgi:hypothetical protein